LKNAPDSLDVCQRQLAADFNRDKLLNQIRGAYQSAPHFARTFALVEQIVRHDDNNLFSYIHHSIVRTCEHLGITSDIRVSSEITIDHELKSQDKVLALCAAVGAKTYVNAIGGMQLYSRDSFRAQAIDLQFIQSKALEYPQFGTAFVPWLSIIDVMMFNSLDAIRPGFLNHYEMI
jgi:hypothetical protein